MSTPSDEQQILDQIQHYPDIEYMDSGNHAHRCYTIPYGDYLYYIPIDPFNRGARRQPLTLINMEIGFGCIPPVTHMQLAQLTSTIPIADIEALFEPSCHSLSNAMYARYGDPSELLMYAMFVTNMRAYKPAESAPCAYECMDRDLDEEHINEIATEQLFWFMGSLINYAQLIVENPAYAYCDTQLLSTDHSTIIDHTGTYHITRCIRWIGWACRYVPLGKQTMFNERSRIPCLGQCSENHTINVFKYSNITSESYSIENPALSWLIEHGVVFYTHEDEYYSICDECRECRNCIRTRAGEKYTCIDISCSYYWQYQVLTAFGPAEHARYVQMCKMIYG